MPWPMTYIILGSALGVLLLFTIAWANVQNSAPHVDEEDDWFMDDYFPMDPDLDGDITDADLH